MPEGDRGRAAAACRRSGLESVAHEATRRSGRGDPVLAEREEVIGLTTTIRCRPAGDAHRLGRQASCSGWWTISVRADPPLRARSKPRAATLSISGLLNTNFHTRAVLPTDPACDRRITCNHMAVISETHGLPGLRSRIPLRTVPLESHRERLRRLRGRKVASRPVRRPALGSRARSGRWARVRAVLRLLGGEPTSGERRWSTTNDFDDQPKAPEDGYHLSEDLTDRANTYIQT